MKKAICSHCGKDLKGKVPNDAEEIICFSCSEKAFKEQSAKANS